MNEVVLNEPEHDSRYSDQYINLAAERLGAKVLFATDDFFAEKENLIKPGRGIFVEHKYTPNGKWMDGWESRRKRVEGHDHAIIKLGLTGTVKALDIDTNWFTGNHPPYASIEACYSPEIDPTDKTEWTEILEKSSLGPGQQNFFEVNSDKMWTHIKLHIYPDGGVARLRVYGEVKREWDSVKSSDLIDLAAVENEGKAVVCNDMYFSHKDNIIMPGRGINMGDGWETKRKREAGNDWLIVALGKSGKISKAIIDTAHFKGNYPDRASLEGAVLEVGQTYNVTEENIEWKPLLPQAKLEAHTIHEFTTELNDLGNITHVRIQIYPDGGVSRLRLFGNIEEK